MVLPVRGLLVPVGDSTSFEVVRSELYLDTIAWQDPDVVHAHFSGNVRQNFMAIFQFDPEHGVGERLDNGPLQYDCVFFRFCQWNFLLREFWPDMQKRASDQQINLSDAGESTNWRPKQSEPEICGRKAAQQEPGRLWSGSIPRVSHPAGECGGLSTSRIGTDFADPL